MAIRIQLTAAAMLLTLMSVFTAATEPTEQRVVYHLDDASNARWAMLLASAHLSQNHQAQIVIVAHGPGVDFLLEDAEDRRGNPYEPDIQELMDRNVRFSICEATLKVRNIDSSQVLEGVKRVPSGAYEIVRLQTDEGYAYLKP